MSVRSFLVKLRHKIDSKEIKGPFCFVTGNQSADLDSVISAISYSYFNNIENSSYVIPLINIPREHFKLRRDITHLLNKHSINESLLYFIEDFKTLTDGMNKTKLILVDHCNIQGETIKNAFNEGRVDIVGIIDHHQDENVFLNAEPRIIETCGSCSSLVFNYWHRKLHEKVNLFTSEEGEIIQLLIGPLLIDTSNMSLKVENGDVTAFEFYKRHFSNQKIRTSSLNNNDNLEEDIVLFYKDLKQAKKDLEGFSFMDILQKDFKQFIFGDNIKVGFSSIGKSSKWIFKKFSNKSIIDALEKMIDELNLDLLVFTTSYTDNTTDLFTREFCYYYRSDNKNAAIFDKLNELANNELILDPIIYKKKEILARLTSLNSDGCILKIFNQGNTSASRKQIVPIVKSILN